MTTEEFKNRASIIHNYFYNYDLVKFENYSKKVKIICPKHGLFEQSPRSHLYNKSKCPICATEQNRISKKKSLEKFIQESKNNHKIKYDYSKVRFENLHEKVEIICPVHGAFIQEANNHLRGQDCPKCTGAVNNSKGSKRVEEFLTENNIKYIKEYKFENCRNKRKLPFDFFLPEENILIEYDGSQHFYPKWGKEKLTKTKTNDKIKNKFCEENKIKLIRINYKENNKIEKILLEEIYGKNNVF